MLLVLLACQPSAPSGVDSAVDSGEAPPAYSTPADCEMSVEPGTVEGLQRWPYLQSGSTDGMTVHGDGNGQVTSNMIYYCTLWIGDCFGSWLWDSFNNFGPPFSNIDDLIFDLGTSP